MTGEVGIAVDVIEMNDSGSWLKDALPYPMVNTASSMNNDIDLHSSIYNRLYDSRHDKPSPLDMRHRSHSCRLRWGVDGNIRVWSVVYL